MSFDPGAAFYLVVPVDRADGTFTPPHADGRESFQTEAEARRFMELDAVDFGGRLVMFRCVPIQVIETPQRD
jgi:hypothetical protein